MRQNNIYCFAFYLKTVSTVFSQFFKNPHVGAYRTCWSFLNCSSRYSFAKILQIEQNNTQEDLCVVATFQNFLLHHLSHHARTIVFSVIFVREAFQQVSLFSPQV